MSWIDDLERRVGLKTVEAAKNDDVSVVDLSAAGASMAESLVAAFRGQPGAEDLVAAAQAVVDGHQRLVEATEFKVTLACGCSFLVYAHGGEEELRSSYAVGYWFSCPTERHSRPVSYDPDTGEPRKYERNQQAVSVERNCS